MKPITLVLTLYALLLFVGGGIGYYVAGSHASIIAGTASCFTLLVIAFAAQKKQPFARPAGLIVVLLLTIFFWYRAYTTGAFMPSGMVGLISTATLLFLMGRE